MTPNMKFLNKGQNKDYLDMFDKTTKMFTPDIGIKANKVQIL